MLKEILRKLVKNNFDDNTAKEVCSFIERLILIIADQTNTADNRAEFLVKASVLNNVLQIGIIMISYISDLHSDEKHFDLRLIVDAFRNQTGVDVVIVNNWEKYQEDQKHHTESILLNIDLSDVDNL